MMQKAIRSPIAAIANGVDIEIPAKKVVKVKAANTLTEVVK
jgi:hypothetical protein